MAQPRLRDILTLLFVIVECSTDLSSIATQELFSSETDYCDFYNHTACLQNTSDCHSYKKKCDDHEPDKRNHCYALWQVNDTTGENSLRMKGCFLDNKQCYDKHLCEENAPYPKKNLLFCCCEGDMCNYNFSWSPEPTKPTVTNEKSQPIEEPNWLFWIIGLVLAVFVVFVLMIVLCHYKRKTLFNELPTMEPSLSCPPSPEGLEDKAHLPITLREVRARGRFGAVWRAHLNQQEVAVKIFPVQDKQSWLSEQEIYKLPRMNHSDILHFIGVEKRGDNLQAEYWLITEYHEKGSLCDFLKANTITWEEALQIAFTMARGLTHLHDEVTISQSGVRKPAVAHRDFKSKNVLLKRDMSACIADFGLALIFQPGIPCGDTHGQVGTRRYMAPEVLEGAINFTRDAFLRIDMYACGLVLWEIASRCTAWGTTLGEYMLPFEEEVGAHPTLEEMQDAVVLRKLRPTIQDAWREHNALYVFCDTMEECWDHDAEARLSASCVMERIGALRGLARRTNVTCAPLLIENAYLLTPHSNRDN